MRADDPVSSIMTESVLSVEITESVREVVWLFAEFPIHHLPVVNKGRLIGMLSSADMLKLEFFVPRDRSLQSDYVNERLRIDTIMRKDVISVGPQRTIEEAAGLMASHGVHALPVASPGGHLIGIVTTSDVMQGLLQGALRHGLEGAAAPGKAQPADEDRRRTAVNAATELFNKGRDVQGMGHVLLSLDRRVRQLEELRSAAERYFRVGQDEQLHAVMLRLLEKLAA